MREMAYMGRLFKQQDRLQKQRERIQGIKRDEPEELLHDYDEEPHEETITEEVNSKKTLTNKDLSGKWAARQAKWNLRRMKHD